MMLVLFWFSTLVDAKDGRRSHRIYQSLYVITIFKKKLWKQYFMGGFINYFKKKYVGSIQ